MAIDTKLWYDLVHTKYGDEYLILYIKRQRSYRNWFKIVTILFSASGIFSAFQSARIPTIVSCSIIGFIQIVTSIENFLIHSEDDLDDLGKLRLLYYVRSNKLEELMDSLQNKRISEEDASKEFFKLRDSAKEIEELDNKVKLRTFKKLKTIADGRVRSYLNHYYNEQ